MMAAVSWSSQKAWMLTRGIGRARGAAAASSGDVPNFSGCSSSEYAASLFH